MLQFKAFCFTDGKNAVGFASAVDNHRLAIAGDDIDIGLNQAIGNTFNLHFSPPVSVFCFQEGS